MLNTPSAYVTCCIRFTWNKSSLILVYSVWLLKHFSRRQKHVIVTLILKPLKCPSWQQQTIYFCEIFLNFGKKRYDVSFVLFDLILYVSSAIFQLYRDGSSWVEPVQSLSLLKDTTQWRQWCSNPRPFRLESNTLPLSPSDVNQRWYFELRDVWASFRYIYRVVYESVQK